VPRTTPAEQAEMAARLVRIDPDFETVVEWAGPPVLSSRRVPGGAFAQLARAIVYQQLAGAAAATIHARFCALFDGPATPEAVLAADPAALRGAGLSAAKAASITDLARLALAGSVRLDRLPLMTDAEVVAELTQVRGIGPWTAEMHLMFQLQRPDVWPVGDLAVRAGFGMIKGITPPPTAKELVPLGQPYAGIRSVVAWYCWREVARSRVSPGG
jgi:DNA-3-methyladenine glycosylase II